MARRVLVLTKEDLADANEVPPLRPLIDEAEQIYVAAPTRTSWMQWLTDYRDGARVSADERLPTVFAHMRADGLNPRGGVGAENQVTVIADALTQIDADLIVLSSTFRAASTRTGVHRIAEKVRSHFDVPTIAFYFDSQGRVSSARKRELEFPRFSLSQQPPSATNVTGDDRARRPSARSQRCGLRLRLSLRPRAG